MEHAFHLGAQHFFKEINPTPASVVKKKLHAKWKTTGKGGMGDTEEEVFEDDNMEVTEEAAEGEEEGGTEDAEFEPGDVVGKALALVTQVSSK
jgi:hypothetical protein